MWRLQRCGLQQSMWKQFIFFPRQPGVFIVVPRSETARQLRLKTMNLSLKWFPLNLFFSATCKMSGAASKRNGCGVLLLIHWFIFHWSITFWISQPVVKLGTLAFRFPFLPMHSVHSRMLFRFVFMPGLVTTAIIVFRAHSSWRGIVISGFSRLALLAAHESVFVEQTGLTDRQ